jgi:hypothetical protein
VRADYVLSRVDPDPDGLLEFFRSADQISIRPVVFVGTPSDFAFILAEASNSYYDFEFIWIAPPLHNPVHPHESLQKELDNVKLGSNLNFSGGIWCLSPPLVDPSVASLEQEIQAILLSRFPDDFSSTSESRDALLAFDLVTSVGNALVQYGPSATLAELQSFILSEVINGTTGELQFGDVERVREGVLASNWIRASPTTSEGQWRSIATWSGSESFDFKYQGNYHFWHGPVQPSKIPSDTFPGSYFSSTSGLAISNKNHVGTVTIAMIYPMQVPEYEHWFHSASVAISHIVDDHTYLPGYRWRFIPIDSHVRKSIHLSP